MYVSFSIKIFFVFKRKYIQIRTIAAFLLISRKHGNSTVKIGSDAWPAIKDEGKLFKQNLEKCSFLTYQVVSNL